MLCPFSLFCVVLIPTNRPSVTDVGASSPISPKSPKVKSEPNGDAASSGDVEMASGTAPSS